MVALALIQTILPLLMILWLAFGGPSTGGDFALRVAASWLLLAGVALAGIWLALPWTTVPLLGLLMFAGTVAGALRLRTAALRPQPSFVGRWIGRVVAVGALVLGAWLTVPAIIGRQQPADTVDIAFPFRSGRWLVANGGSTERVNAHFMTLQPRYEKWRGQSHAVDLIRIDEWGFRTRGRRLLALPRDPAEYLSFGEPVYTPCRGTVTALENGRDDMPVPIRDRAHLLGNFVLLRCGAHHVFLGHFKQGSIIVGPGQRVEVNQRLGLVGNSGNSDEPHLHVHVQEIGRNGLAARPYFLTFDGSFPVRNFIIDAKASR